MRASAKSGVARGQIPSAEAKDEVRRIDLIGHAGRILYKRESTGQSNRTKMELDGHPDSKTPKPREDSTRGPIPPRSLRSVPSIDATIGNPALEATP